MPSVMILEGFVLPRGYTETQARVSRLVGYVERTLAVNVQAPNGLVRLSVIVASGAGSLALARYTVAFVLPTLVA